ncbi:cysteine desulfurase family protein (TIGR01976 family) [Streptomonospora nanhaiensis]|uniref:Cysteine desulfurase family protein (TIGR01976 family) n=1 Tax=Streptomonospora nanhaiensis TaxID=1323731 RepID=A0A853BKM7_9ACTN|nr:aminotransferase class V-fold PLP-dependent enzyme [Streptomonospora nanhaiensis]NYI95207.1 cysteine desulfurase family protein (TIGR01976 family) [Streptomonospora nanhaiensis]
MRADDVLPRPLADYLARPLTAQFPGRRPGQARFDGPAGTLVHAAVADAVAGYLAGPAVSNDGGAYPAGRHSDALAAWARAAVRRLLGAPGGHVVFGPNMTTLTALFVRAAAEHVRPGDEIVCTELDHEANVAPWRAMARRRGAVVRTARLEEGALPASAVADVLSARTRWVAVSAASNALGATPDLAAVCAAAHRVGARVFVDAVQAVPHRAVDAAAWGADAVVASAYKFYGPHAGVLWIADEAAEPLRLAEQPSSAGDDLPGRLEPGTLAFEQLLGTAVAAEVLLGWDRAAVAEREAALARDLAQVLEAAPGVRRLTPGGDRVPVEVFFLPGMPAAEAAEAFAERGVSLTHGRFYAPGPLGAVAPGLPAALRAGVACYTTGEDVAAFAGALKEVAADAR